MMIEFFLNDRKISTAKSGSTTVLDFVRQVEHQHGTKIGCREGDCGACTVLVGSLTNGTVHYDNVTSCLTPIGNVHGKHVVTVEGLTTPELNEVQKAMVEHSGTQCGFCTPGFVTSLGGFALTCENPTKDAAISAIDGNICRCTGYKSIEKAATQIAEKLAEKDTEQPLEWLVKNNFVPDYFTSIPEKLNEIAPKHHPKGKISVGGGTDLYVQKHDDLHDENLTFLSGKQSHNRISFQGETCVLKASATVSDLIENPVLLERFPNWHRFLKLVSSTPIRNIGTVAGNFANASPIGDLTILFLALDAMLVLYRETHESRTIALKEFYKGYKKLDKTDDEIIAEIHFQLPSKNTVFNFEKVSKRQYLDIASVNSACQISVSDGKIVAFHASMGGVGPVPLYLRKTRDFMLGKELSTKTILAAEVLLQSEISPISDARGDAAYKRLLGRQLFFSHFLTLFPAEIAMEDLV